MSALKTCSRCGKLAALRDRMGDGATPILYVSRPRLEIKVDETADTAFGY